MTGRGWLYHGHEPTDQDIKEMRVKTKFGITLDRYEDILAGGCSICGAHPKMARMCLDHNHDTGQVRGALCNGCNSGLGHFKDNPERLRAAAEYLDGYEELEAAEDAVT